MISDLHRIRLAAWLGLGWLVALVAQPGFAAPALDFALPDREGPWRLTFFEGDGSEARTPSTGFSLTGHGEVLLGRTNAQGQTLPWEFLKIGGMKPSGKSDPIALTRASGPDWQFVAGDASAWFAGRLAGFERRALFVEPDLFVIWDKLGATNAMEIALRICAPNTVRYDSIRSELVSETTKAGLTMRCFTSPHGLFQQWETGSEKAGLNFLQATGTNQVTGLNLITVLVPHATGNHRSLAFKLLESDTAIGVRVHRDGLPTLVSFNRAPGTPAELTGLKFSTPVAVDVFRSKKKTLPKKP